MMLNYLDILLNRVYTFLTKVNNQSPLFGAVSLISLLINIYISCFITIIYLINNTYKKLPSFLYYVPWLIIFIILYRYTTKNDKKILNKKVDKKHNFFVSIFIILSVILFVLIANENRERISKDKVIDHNKPKKESLEGRIRKWFDEK